MSFLKHKLGLPVWHFNEHQKPPQGSIWLQKLDWALVVCLPLLCGYIGASAGRDLNWDQLNYHVYIAHAFLTGRLDSDFNAASVVSYVNPIPYVPFYLLINSPFDSWLIAFLMGTLQGVALALVYTIARMTTAPSTYSVAASLAITAIALTHPVVIAELGSSLVEITASIPLLAGIALLFALRTQQNNFRSMLLVFFAFLMSGIAVAMKLPSLIFAAGLFLFPLLYFSGLKTRMTALSLAGLGLIVGWIIGGGFWHLRLWEHFGNPFFPFFNNFFHAPDFPAVALANDRFVQKSLIDVLIFPWRMVEFERFVTTERLVFDPRYATTTVLFLLAIAALVVKKKRGVIFQIDRFDGIFVAVFVFWYTAWAITSGNGRYALPMHLLSGIAIAILINFLSRSALATAKALSYGAICLTLVALVLANEAHWTRMAHSKEWYGFTVPDAVKAKDGLYLSAGYFDRSSKSFLIPEFPSTARFANLNGYSNPLPNREGGGRIKQMIDAHRGPVFLLTEGVPYGEGKDALNLNLNGYGLKLAPETQCIPIGNKQPIDSSQVKWQKYASVCALEKSPPVDHRREKTEVDAAFDKYEKTHPEKLYPAGEGSYFLGEAYCRFYAPLEYYMCERNGLLEIFRIDPWEKVISVRIHTEKS